MSWHRVFHSGRSNAEPQQESALHLAGEMTKFRDRGMNPDNALRQDYLKPGNHWRLQEGMWLENIISRGDGLWRDVNHVLRKLAKSPSFVLTVVASLGFGIAANAVIFSMVSRLLLQGPPVGNPTSLLDIHPTYNHGQVILGASFPLYDDLRDQTRSFSGIAAYDDLLPASIEGRNVPERVWGQSVTTNFFDVAQLPMTLGRGFANDEEHSPVVVLGYQLWKRRFLGDTAIVGKGVLLSGRTFTVIGVGRPGFHGISPLLNPEFWVPLGEREQLAPIGERERIAPESLQNHGARSMHWLGVIARLKAGQSRTQANAELDALARRLAIAYPDAEKDLGFETEQAGMLLKSAKAIFGEVLVMLTVVALLVLCIACSNVANLLLVHGVARHKEMAIRISLGATRIQLLWPMLLESALLALGGGGFGVLLCIGALHFLSLFHLPMAVPINLSLNIDWRVVLYAFLLSTGTGFLCGIGPALIASRPTLPKSLKGESSLAPLGRCSMRNILAVMQISLCLVLLCTAGLFLRSLFNAARLGTGFRSSGVLMMSIDPQHNGYKKDQIVQLLTRLRERIQRLPGVMSVAYTDAVQLSMSVPQAEFDIASETKSPQRATTSDLYQVSASYFDTMGIARIAGRDLNAVDPNIPKQAVVNEAFVQRMFRGRNPMGERVVAKKTTYEIVGVVRNTKSRSIGESEEKPILYGSLEQNIGTNDTVLGYSLLVHYSGNPAELAAAMRNEVHAEDPALAVFNEKRMEEHLSDALILPHVAATVFSVFGFVGLLLATVGLYGVMSYSMSRRMHEIGIRLALGASREGVQWLIVRQGMFLSGIALAIGLPIALAASKLAASALYGVAPYDRVTFTMVPIFLVFVTLVACWIPARGVATVELQTALRCE